MFGVQPEHRHSGQEFSRESGVLLSIVRTDGLCLPLIDAVAETQSAVVMQEHDGLGKVVVCFYRQQVTS